MCGISGIISKDKSVELYDAIKEFNTIISHRGPDDEGFYFYDSVALAHRRLSILDLSPNGHQPMHYADRYSIVFNGEIYNYIEIKEELISRGYSFNSQTDTEVILAAYDQWKESCVERFNGMWAFAILDKVKNILFCSRDRFGVKPFYYRISDQTFSFASEIKQFTTLADWTPQPNIERAADFLQFGIFDHTEETLFKDVLQLRGGCNLVYNLQTDELSVNQWYDLRSRVKQFKGSFEEAKKQFRELFTSAVKLRLRSDVKVGSCLSGGLDSTSIVCSVNKILTEEKKNDLQETVSACYEEKKYDEQHFIDQVVAATDVTAHKIYPDLDRLIKMIDHLVWHQDEPFSSSSIFAQYCVFEEARKNNLIVMLDGQGADETLAGYPPFHDAHLIGLLKAFNFAEVFNETRALRSLKGYSRKKAWQFMGKYLLPGNIAARLSEKGAPLITYPHLNTEKLYKARFFDTVQEMSYDQLYISNLPMLLHYEDRNSMAHSIESRVPFLDYRLVEFIVSLPDSFKIQAGQTKYILREALSDLIPDSVKNRHDKMGFVTPESVWIKQNASQVRKMLQNAATDLSLLLNGKSLLESFDNNINNDNNISIGSLYFRVLTFHRWMKQFNISFHTDTLVSDNVSH